MEPGWRMAWVTWLKLLRLKSKPPTSERIAPLAGSIATKAPSTVGICTMLTLLPCSTMRITAPRRMRCTGVTRSDSALRAKVRPRPRICSLRPPRR
ncbi:hypothetical protein D3C72_1723450 [compost metagenome]